MIQMMGISLLCVTLLILLLNESIDEIVFCGVLHDIVYS